MNLFLASPFSQFCEGEEDIIIKNRWFFEKIIKESKYRIFLFSRKRRMGFKICESRGKYKSRYKWNKKM